MPQPSL
jgi:hypothetical protein